MTKPISALPDPTDANPDQWSIVARDDVPELWGTMRRGGKQRHNGQHVYPCLDKAHAVDLLRALLEARKLYDLRKGQSQYALGATSPSRLETVRATLGRPVPRTREQMAAFARSWDAKVEQGRK